MYGGQSYADFSNDLAYLVDLTRQEIKQDIIKANKNSDLSEEEINEITEEKLLRVVRQSMQNVCYNLNTMHSRAGSQVPFSSINIGLPKDKDAALIEEELLKEFNKGMGKGTILIFPNIIYRLKDGVNKKEGDPYYYLYKLACKVASRRMNPTFMNIDADFNKEYYDKGYTPATMG